MVGEEMSKYPDLVNRLRQLNIKYGDEAADAIEHLMLEIDVLDYAWETDKERIAELKAALKPFAEMTATIIDEKHMSYSFTCDDIRAAVAAYRDSRE